MREHRITMVTLPPSILAELPDDGLPHLETVVSAGEACSAAVVARWASERRFLNAYGPSEVTVCATAAVCEPDGLAPLIGSALAHVRVSVLDDQLALVGAGKAGELCIAGDALARGYLGMPAHTAIAFVPDHHAERPGQRMYRTGDLVEIDPSGALRYVTRADQQVKIRGYRIELGEIEHELRDEFGVRDAHVFDATDPHGDRHLVAYVIPATLDGDELRARLRARLPEFMVPARVIGVDHWPLSPNGKIDRAALPSADHVLAVDGRTYTAPRDATELALVKIWEDVLGRAPIGIDDDFFALGGHSLLALRVTAKARDVLGLTSTIETIAEYPTIASFAHHVRSSAYHPGSRTGSCVLQSGQRQSPLFFVPPIHGSPLCYVPVARMLGDAWTCIGLLAPGLAGEIEPPATVEAIADVYVKEIRARQPVGPYRLVGWSMGGIAAFEIARQLERAGETVASLALIDATVPTPAHCAYWRARFGDFTLADMAYVFLRNIVRSLDKTVELSPLHYAGWSADDVERDVLARLQELQIVPPETALRDVRLRLDVFRVTVRSMYDDPVSVTAKFPRDVFAFNSADGHPFMPADCPNGTWDEFVAGRVETRAVPGDHYTVCHPANAAALAAALSAALTPPPDRVR
jgi:thioesterase domain-containing protein